MIVSPKNERIRRYRRLRKKNFRYREARFLVEGMQAVIEALNSSYKPECLLCMEKGLEFLEANADIIRLRGIPCFTVNEEVMSYLATTVNPQGVIAVLPFVHRGVEEILGEHPAAVLVANRVRDPGNLGNMVRAADAAGAEAVIVCKESADLYNPKTVRSTAGSIFHLPLATEVDIASAIYLLKEAGYKVFAADAHDGSAVWDVEWPERLALVMGNEAWGMPRAEEEMADEVVHVPVFGKAESMNVASAAAVILYEVRRRLLLAP